MKGVFFFFINGRLMAVVKGDIKMTETKGVKIVTIGGGSSYTPELMQGFIKR